MERAKAICSFPEVAEGNLDSGFRVSGGII